MTKKSVQHVGKNSSSANTIGSIAGKSATTNAINITGHSHASGYVTAGSTLSYNGSGMAWGKETTFESFKNILNSFGLKYKYSPKSNGDTWGLKVGDKVIYSNKGWYYFDGEKTKSESDTISYLLKELKMDVEEALWKIGGNNE